MQVPDSAPSTAPPRPRLPLASDLFEQHGVRVVRFARLLGARDAEDVAQDAFVRLLGRLDSGGLEGTDFDAGRYLNRTVVNLVRDRHRRRSTANRWILLSRRDAEQSGTASDDHAVRADEVRLLVTALDRLPHRRREAVVLRYWLDLTYGEIADAMGTSIGAAKSAVSRGLDDLHTHLDPALSCRPDGADQ